VLQQLGDYLLPGDRAAVVEVRSQKIDRAYGQCC
jgi:hypothetical protein